MRKRKRVYDLTGQKFGRLTVIKPVRIVMRKSNRPGWLCKCDCGNDINVLTDSLKSGNTKSCGCIEKERCHTEGSSKERLYRIWCDMKKRCYRKNCKSYKHYGARGIKVCDEWKDDYEAFRKWSYENGYDETLTRWECSIDRIDPNKDYRPDNCRWTNKYVQANNRTSNHYVTINGETKTISQWARERGIWPSTISYRIREMGYTPEEALDPKSKRDKNGYVGKHTNVS